MSSFLHNQYLDFKKLLFYLKLFSGFCLKIGSMWFWTFKGSSSFFHTVSISNDSIILRISHGNKEYAKIAENFQATCSNVNYFLITVESKYHYDAHQHGEQRATDRKINWSPDCAHWYNHSVPDHDLRKVFHDLVWDTLQSSLLPFFISLQLILGHVLQLGLVFYHTWYFFGKGILIIILNLLLHGLLYLCLHLLLVSLKVDFGSLFSLLLLLLLLLLLWVLIFIRIHILIIIIRWVVLLLLLLLSLPGKLLLLHLSLQF